MLLAFFTFGLQVVICSRTADRVPLTAAPDWNAWAIQGEWYLVPEDRLTSAHPTSIDYVNGLRTLGYRDITSLFANSIPTPTCTEQLGIDPPLVCVAPNGMRYCHQASVASLQPMQMGIGVSFEWETIRDPRFYFVVYNGYVLDVAPLFVGRSSELVKMTTSMNTAAAIMVPTSPFGPDVDAILETHFGRDATAAFARRPELALSVQCLLEKYKIGHVSQQTPGCFAAMLVSVVTLVIILGFVAVRFFMALAYAWFVAPRLSRREARAHDLYLGNDSGVVRPPFLHSGDAGQRAIFGGSSSALVTGQPKQVDVTRTDDMYVAILVTCYSEGEQALRSTMESIASAHYDDRRKLVFLIADGLVTGGGNTRSTPDICISMLSREDGSCPPALSYVAIGEGGKRHNMARVVGFRREESNY